MRQLENSYLGCRVSNDLSILNQITRDGVGSMDVSVIISIVTINLLLSSDNALAIAMASRNLEPNCRKRAVLWGSICAVLAQILLTYAAVLLLSVPYLKLVGGIMLAWIAARMIIDDNVEGNNDTHISQHTLSGAVRAIAAANLIMSLDNVLAVAAVAGGNSVALGLGLLVSFPIIMWGSIFISNLLERWPVLIWLGSVFLGWTAGSIISTEHLITSFLMQYNINRTIVSALVALGISFVAWHKAVYKTQNGEVENTKLTEN